MKVILLKIEQYITIDCGITVYMLSSQQTCDTLKIPIAASQVNNTMLYLDVKYSTDYPLTLPLWMQLSHNVWQFSVDSLCF